MAKNEYDGVITAVHFNPDKQVDWVRAFLRYGPQFSDRIMLDRQTLIDQIQSGKKFKVGERVAYEAGTFKVSDPVHVIEVNGDTILVAGETQAEQDNLGGVPII
jgi:hypothetical protein